MKAQSFQTAPADFHGKKNDKDNRQDFGDLGNRVTAGITRCDVEPDQRGVTDKTGCINSGYDRAVVGTCPHLQGVSFVSQLHFSPGM